MTNLNRNASKVGCGGKENYTQKIAAANLKTCSKTTTSDEIAALLGRHSSHAQEADDDWFEGYGKKLNKLAFREAKSNDEGKVHEITIRAFHCTACMLTTEDAPALCRRQGHSVSTVICTKRFFECSSCSRRENCLGAVKMPKRTCTHCGAFSWKPCGKHGSGAAFGGSSTASKSLVGPLILSASEWSSRGDRDIINTLVSGI